MQFCNDGDNDDYGDDGDDDNVCVYRHRLGAITSAYLEDTSPFRDFDYRM